MAFLQSFGGYLINAVILLVVGYAGVMTGIKLRQRKNSKEKTI